MIILKIVWYVVDFIAVTLGWIILVNLLIVAVNGGNMQFTVNGTEHCYGTCSNLETSKGEVIK